NVTSQILRVGYALNSIYVLQTIGFLTQEDINKNVARYGAEQEGDLKYQDTNGDGVITEADKVIVGHPNPDYTYGITNTFRYKGFDLNVLVQGQWGGSIYSELGRALNRPGQGKSDNHTADYVDRWRSPTNQGDGRYGKTFPNYYSSIVAATFYQQPSDFIQAVNAAYNSLRGYPDRQLFLSEVRSDNIYPTNDVARDPDPINNFSTGIAANVYVEEAWTADFNGIFRANTVIEQIVKNNTYVGSAALANRLTAE